MKKILLIENDEDLQLMFALLFRLENFQVISTENSTIGLGLAKELHPDLILCDLNMPEIDGYGFLKALREDVTTANIPFVVLAGESEPESCQLAMQLGADDYLPKPKLFSSK